MLGLYSAKTFCKSKRRNAPTSVNSLSFYSTPMILCNSSSSFHVCLKGDWESMYIYIYIYSYSTFVSTAS